VVSSDAIVAIGSGAIVETVVVVETVVGIVAANAVATGVAFHVAIATDRCTATAPPTATAPQSATPSVLRLVTPYSRFPMTASSARRGLIGHLGPTVAIVPSAANDQTVEIAVTTATAPTVADHRA
jgi:hypothetical protein